MRLIGHLTSEASAATFSDFLHVKGISNEIEPEKEGWAVWIHSDDELARAREWLEGFLGNPADPRYAREAAEARQVRERESRAEREAGAGFLDRTRVFSNITAIGVGRLTLVLVLACLGITGLGWAGYEDRLLETLLMTRIIPEGSRVMFSPGLPEIRSGELWRLVSPVLVHLSVTHLLFNMMGLYYFGNLLEARLGTWRLALLMLLLAVFSNLAQYFIAGPYFSGISGVLYGLFGYAWLRGRQDPGSGLALEPQTVIIMMGWFVLCLAGAMGATIANTAHGAGLVLGMMWGWLESRFTPRRQMG